LLAKYVAVVEYRPILPVNIVSQFQSSTFGHNYPTLQRGLSAMAEFMLTICIRYNDNDTDTGDIHVDATK